MKLIIVESPNKCAKIKSYLSNDYEVIASVGHINRIRNSGAFNLGIDLNKKFAINYELMPEKISVLQKILDKVEESEEEINLFHKWADDDFTTLSGLMRKIISEEKNRRKSKEDNA